MRYAVLVGMGLLVIGALFVWFRGASRTEEVLEDDLDAVGASCRPRTERGPRSVPVRTCR